MRAMILAAGRGERMRHLTEELPKPLLRFKGKYLIEYSLLALIKAGITEIIINVCYHAEKIKALLGTGQQYGINIIYSDEIEALETGGGILQALPLLGKDPFIVVSCDVVCDYALQALPKFPEKLAHLVLVNNPSFHPKGDFSLDRGKIYLPQEKTYTFSNIGVYRPELFEGRKLSKFRLGDLLREKIQTHDVTGEHFNGYWRNIGTPEDLI